MVGRSVILGFDLRIAQRSRLQDIEVRRTNPRVEFMTLLTTPLTCPLCNISGLRGHASSARRGPVLLQAEATYFLAVANLGL
jgi:hypothetical protein